MTSMKVTLRGYERILSGKELKKRRWEMLGKREDKRHQMDPKKTYSVAFQMYMETF